MGRGCYARRHIIAHKGLKIKNNHLDRCMRPSAFAADPTRGWEVQDPTQSRARCSAHGQGCCRGHLGPLARTKPPLCPQREGRGRWLHWDNGKTNPRTFLKLEIHVFKYHIVQQEHSHSAGSEVGLIPQHRVPCLQTPACKPLPASLEQKPSPAPTCPARVPVPAPCTGPGRPRGTGGTQSSTSSSAESREVKEMEFGHCSPVHICTCSRRGACWVQVPLLCAPEWDDYVEFRCGRARKD